LPEKLKILIIDDEPIVGKRLVPALTKTGYEVEFFESGVAGLKRIEEERFDIVVTDVRMDEVDGMEVLGRVREQSPHSKVIIITGYATIEVAREAMTKGAFDFIAKPFKPDDLRDIIQRAAEALESEKG
jgi:DNA-binding NtrC family response regulator